MPAACSRWPRAPTIRPCSGCEPESRGIAPARRFPLPPPPRPDGPAGRLRGADRHRFRSGHRRLRGACARPAQDLDQRAASASSMANSSSAATATRSRPGRTGELVGGLYGVSIGAAFFGESMFSRRTDASKVALVHLVARLRAGGYRLLDAQFITEHLDAVRRGRGRARGLYRHAGGGDRRGWGFPRAACAGERGGSAGVDWGVILPLRGRWSSAARPEGVVLFVARRALSPPNTTPPPSFARTLP